MASGSIFQIAILDKSQIGPGNFDWTFPPEASRTSKEGIEAHNRARRERQGDLIRDRDFRKKYGISYADYVALLAEQDGVCAACRRAETKVQFGSVRIMLSVDHDQNTKQVRGLLCGNCNHGIGMFGTDRPDLLRAAADYLDHFYGRKLRPLLA